MRQEEVEMKGRMADMAKRMRQLGEEKGQVATELRRGGVVQPCAQLAALMDSDIFPGIDLYNRQKSLDTFWTLSRNQ